VTTYLEPKKIVQTS